MTDMAHLVSVRRLKKCLISLAFASGLATATCPGLAGASTPPPAPDLTTELKAEEPATAEELKRAQQVEITTPPPARLRMDHTQDYFYHYRQALSFHGGVSSNLADPANLSSTVGFQYRFSYPQQNRAEVGADLLTSGTGLIHASRFHFLDDSRFRFFYKYGLEIRVVPSEELVTFLKLVNWRARLAGGFEWNTWGSVGIRLAFEAHIGTTERTLTALGGLAYSF